MEKKENMFYVFEGIEGAGKTTLIKILEEQLKNEGKKVMVTSEPTGKNNSFGTAIRKLIMEEKTSALTEFLLFSSFRSKHVVQIKQWLKEGYIVLCDRFIYSSIVYQGNVGKVDINFINQVNEYILKDLHPKKIFLIDVDPKIAQKRNKQEKDKNDKFDLAPLEFHKNIRKNYLKLADENLNFKVINGNETIEEIIKVITLNL